MSASAEMLFAKFRGILNGTLANNNNMDSFPAFKYTGSFNFPITGSLHIKDKQSLLKENSTLLDCQVTLTIKQNFT